MKNTIGTSNFIYIKGRFDQPMIAFFKEALHRTKGTTVTVRVNSRGGNVHCMNVMSAFLYFLIKYRGYDVTIEIEHAESAALMFAVNIPKRLVTQRSIGSIHLPVPNTNGRELSKKSIKEKVLTAISFFKFRTRLSVPEIRVLNNQPLTGREMYEYGIATELVSKFP